MHKQKKKLSLHNKPTASHTTVSLDNTKLNKILEAIILKEIKALFSHFHVGTFIFTSSNVFCSFISVTQYRKYFLVHSTYNFLHNNNLLIFRDISIACKLTLYIFFFYRLHLEKVFVLISIFYMK